MSHPLPDRFTSSPGEWLRGDGPESDIVISTRIRLARNVAGFPFLPKISLERKAELERLLRDRVLAARVDDNAVYWDLDTLSPVDRLLLVERHLISRELANSTGHRGVTLGRHESLSIMTNEEDHLRIQAIRSGLQIEETYRLIADVDHRLEAAIPYAFSERFGYLTACPTNTGTGMRVSVMVHLPALVMTKQVEKVFTAAMKVQLVVRGLYGEGTHPSGDFYQISNQKTLGVSEESTLRDIRRFVLKVLEWERGLRRKMLADSREVLEDKVWRAFGVLQRARIISSEETMELLSLIRLGVNLELFPRLKIGEVNELFLLSQPGHLQKLKARELDSKERDLFRAEFIRARLQSEKN